MLEGNGSTNSGMLYIDMTTYYPQKIQDAHKNILFKNARAQQMNNIYEIKKKQDIIKYLSHAMWNLVPQT